MKINIKIFILFCIFIILFVLYLVSCNSIKNNTIVESIILNKKVESTKGHLQDNISKRSYNPDNFDITYHTNTIDIQPDESTAGVGKMWLRDPSGKLISVAYARVKNTTLYNTNDPYGPSSYVPNYEESVLLSKFTNK